MNNRRIINVFHNNSRVTIFLFIRDKYGDVSNEIIKTAIHQHFKECGFESSVIEKPHGCFLVKWGKEESLLSWSWQKLLTIK